MHIYHAKGMGPMCSMKPTLDAHTTKTLKLYATRFHSLPSTSKAKFYPGAVDMLQHYII